MKESDMRQHLSAPSLFRNPRRTIYLLLGVIVVLILTTIYLSVKASRTSPVTSSVQSANTVSQVQLKKPLAQEKLNKKFSFPIRDNSGKLIGNLSYVLENAELRDQIIINGAQATSVKGREFLILNIKITNNYKQQITINARDYVRLMRNGTNELLAPDIHNDPVDVQAISTKYTRLGFPINTTDRNLKLQVGEINGKKEIIPLTLQ